MISLPAAAIALSVAISASRGSHALLMRIPISARKSHRAIMDSSRDIQYNLSLCSNGSRRMADASDVTGESDSMLTGCKIIYFGIPGRGEAIRLALAIGGVKFEDKRVPFPAWGKIKPTTPWGTLPVLELADGLQISQARSVLRFVGKYTGLYPSDQLVAQRVDELMDALEDLGAIISNVGQGLSRDDQEAARLMAVSDGGVVYNLLKSIDEFIEVNGTGGYAVGNEMNIASILTFTNIGRLVGGVFYGVPPTVCDPFPNIQLVRKTVGCTPAVVAWYDARIEKQKSLSPAEQILVSCRNM